VPGSLVLGDATLAGEPSQN